VRRTTTLTIAVLLCAVAVLVGRAGAQAPTPDPIVSFQVLVSGAAGQKVLDIRGAPNAASSAVRPVIITGGLMISPKLCVRGYHLDFVFTRESGAVIDNRLTATVKAATLDRRAARCPFASLPIHGLSSLQVLITAKAGTVMTFAARPLARSGAIFGQLLIPMLSYYPLINPLGNDRIRVKARYGRGGVHIVTLSVAVASPPPAA
jgi:hypothetical protein